MLRRLSGALLLLLPLASAPAGAAQAVRCTFLTPIGGDGSSPLVVKRVGPPKLSPLGLIAGQTNWNTDFIVDRPYASYKFFFTANSSDPAARYPVEGFMKFTDGTSLQVIRDVMNPPIGSGRLFGPFSVPPGKQASQMNVKVGSSRDPGASGFSYRIAVQGCL